jgi:hypothetical protein
MMAGYTVMASILTRHGENHDFVLVTHSKHAELTQKCNKFTLSKGVTIISALNRSAQEDKLWINRPDRNFYLVFQALEIVQIRSRQKIVNKISQACVALKVPKCEILMSWILMIFLS